ncbi:hypothetical protein HJW21_00375 [[Clostridium] symbiosum]|nr:hypothetical protein [[Clostridium] symbiosum]
MKRRIRVKKSERKESNFRKMMHKGKAVLTGAAMASLLCTTNVYASGTEVVTQPLDNLKNLVIAIIGAVGVIILAKNVMEFAQSYQQQDSSSMNSAIKGIVAGLIMAGISTVLTFLGIG